MIITQSTIKRFWGMVDIRNSSDCWKWKGARKVRNYGGIWVDKKSRLAHRMALNIAGVNIPDNKVVDHLCKNPICVNPNHLEVVTQKENVARGNADWKKNLTHCKKGHEFTEENTYRYKGHRSCNKCRYDAVIRYNNKK